MTVRFILEIIDSETGCPVRSFAIEPADSVVISSLLDDNGFDPRSVYDLDPHETAAILSYFGFVAEEPPLAILRPRHELDNRPYQVHTNRELALMLDGVKPFAAFSEEYPLFGEESHIPEKIFDRHVADGRFVKREFVSTRIRDGYRLRKVLYARPGEAWRIDAYILLWHTAEQTGWNETLERMEGFLLGYEEWQTALHIAAARARKATGQPASSDSLPR